MRQLSSDVHLRTNRTAPIKGGAAGWPRLTSFRVAEMETPLKCYIHLCGLVIVF